MFKKLKRQTKDKEFEWTKNDDKVMLAIEMGDMEKLHMTLAKKGTSPTKLDAEGRTPLHVAAQKGQYPCLEVLLQLGANPRASDGQGCTALHCASKGGHLNSMHRLIMAGVPINAQDFNGKTALHFSAGSGHIEGTILLLQCGASIDVPDEYGKTALMSAAQSGHVSVCKDLIDKGAAVNIQDHIQKTLLMVACENGHREVVDLLTKRGARADLVDAQGFDAKYYAEGNGQPNLTELLDSAPSVATWDVRNEDEDNYDEVAPDAVDYVDTFEVANERAESPQPINKNQQNNISPDFPSTPSRAISMPALNDSKTDDLKELEEENDFLNEELNKVNIAHKRALERIRSLEGQANEAQIGDLKQKLEAEEDKRKEAEKEINDLKNKLSSLKLKETKDSFEEEDDDEENDDTNSVGSWGDSEDDLFDLPGTKKAPKKPVKLSLDIKSSQQKAELQQLKAEMEALRKENENLKNQAEADGSMPPAPSVPKTELDQVRATLEARTADLEEELASLKEELEETSAHDRSHVVPYQEYQELKAAGDLELAAVKKENLLLKEEIGNISQRLATMTERSERAQDRVVELQELQLRPVSSSSADFRFNELLQEKLELEDMINKHSEVLAEQADDVESLKKDVERLVAEKLELEGRLQEKSGAVVREEEVETLRRENERLQSVISKQSKAIAQQTDRMRKDKTRLGEVIAERDQLAQEVETGKLSGSNREGDEEERRVLEAENRRLMEQMGALERSLENAAEEKRRTEELTAENWRLQDSVRKAEDELLLKTAQLSKLQATKTGPDGARLEEENRRARERTREVERELRVKAAEHSELLVENAALKARLGEVEDVESEFQNGGLSNGDMKRAAELAAENAKLKETVEKLRGGGGGMRNGGLVNGVNEEGGGGGGGTATASLKEVARLRQQMAEMDARHKETVNIYRAHLLSAVQDEISPEVKQALQQIVKLRNETPVT